MIPRTGEAIFFQLRAMALHGFFNTTARPAKSDLQRRLVGCPTYCDDETSERLHNCSAAFLDEAALTIRFLICFFFFGASEKKVVVASLITP